MAMEHDAASRQWQERHTQALRDAAGALEIGRATAHTLSMQSEQLGRSDRVLDETQATIDTSKRILRGMTWSGWVYNKFSTAPQLSTTTGPHEIVMGFICPDCKVKFASPEQLGVHYGNVHKDVGVRREARQVDASVQQRQLRTENKSVSKSEDVHEKFLQDLEPQLAELKQASLALGSALDSQNAQLDQLDSKIGRVHHDMKRVGIQANKLAGRKVPVMFRFRCAFQEAKTRRFLRDVDGEPTLSAEVVVDGCTFRAYTLGDDSDVWGFQSEKSSQFLGVNRYGNLKVRGADFCSYEQFLIEAKPKTTIFCLSSYFGLGGWIATREAVDATNLTIIRGTTENKSHAAQFSLVNLDDGILKEAD
ncbi:hypothetical protein PHYBOEH_011817 [Phytophthora boehmeriae]|uniref:t-SNARE coiled-coil homology domain-containing protein n=1 Tax=Phytophthora boehmeriae TaxID=109152 RepID=A0A8T1VFC2_9STRA|nr:hypothetical protein PHYBOEH_011817 [Phytophthora boehmeriae]